MKKHWFKRKLYGWGWTPVTWQGWLVILTFIALVVGVPFVLDFFLDLENNPNREPIIGLITIGVSIISVPLLIWISYAKGEKPKWQWGEREERDEE